MQPLRSRRRRLTGHSRRRKALLAFGVIVRIIVGDIPAVGGEVASATKVSGHPPHRALERLAHLVRSQMAERLPRKLGAVLSGTSRREDDVQMGIEPIGKVPAAARADPVARRRPTRRALARERDHWRHAAWAVLRLLFADEKVTLRA